MGSEKKKMAIAGVASLILVAMVVAVTVGVTNNHHTVASPTAQDSNPDELHSSVKAIKSICQPTDYKEACVESLSSVAGNNTTDPKELVKLAFQVAIDTVKKAFNESEFLKKAASDPRTSKAIENCGELMDFAVDDLESSVKRFDNFSIAEIDQLVDDIKIWLSAAMTYEETCLDGFEGTPGDTADKMRKILKGGMELTSNTLAIVNEISSMLASLNIGFTRKLLSTSNDGFPSWVSDGKRRLLAAGPETLKPNVVVAKDGSGDVNTINAALAKVPKKSNVTFVIYIKAGVYQEYLLIERSMRNVVLIGDGPTKTKITGNRNFMDGTPTFKTATVAVVGDGFVAKNLGIENTAGAAKHQAVALRVQSDRSVFYNCQIDGYQDTLYTHTHRQFYRDCTVSGTIDFIFGNAAVVFQNCKLVVRKPMDNQQNIVTAQGRKDKREPTAIVIQNCTITAEPALFPLRNKVRSYLGRPWKEYSRTLIFQSQIDDLIQPEGWLPWNAQFALNTCSYSEFNNRGPGAALTGRVKWKCIRSLTADRAAKFTPQVFLGGNSWIGQAGVPFQPGL